MPDNGVDDYVEASTLWPEEIRVLRPILLGAGLDETVKWNKPCYTHDGANIAIAAKTGAETPPDHTKTSGATMAPAAKAAFSIETIDAPRTPKACMTRGLNEAAAMP